MGRGQEQLYLALYWNFDFLTVISYRSTEPSGYLSRSILFFSYLRPLASGNTKSEGNLCCSQTPNESSRCPRTRRALTNSYQRHLHFAAQKSQQGFRCKGKYSCQRVIELPSIKCLWKRGFLPFTMRKSTALSRF